MNVFFFELKIGNIQSFQKAIWGCKDYIKASEQESFALAKCFSVSIDDIVRLGEIETRFTKTNI